MRKGVILLTYGSYNNDSSYKRARPMAGRLREADRRVPRTNRSRPVGKSQGGLRRRGVHAAGREYRRSRRPFEQKGVLAILRGIADTGFLVAFANRHDRHHEWAVSVARQVSTPILTCEAVLAETAFHLENTGIVFAMIRDGLTAIAFQCSEHLLQLEALASRYSDRKPDLADLCLVRMSELHPAHKVITVDQEDFRVYRRNKREMIPVIVPPN